MTAAERADSVAGPTTPSSVRPEDAWKDLTACAVAGPNFPSMVVEYPSATSASCTCLTSAPLAPLRRTTPSGSVAGVVGVDEVVVVGVVDGVVDVVSVVVSVAVVVTREVVVSTPPDERARDEGTGKSAGDDEDHCADDGTYDEPPAPLALANTDGGTRLALALRGLTRFAEFGLVVGGRGTSSACLDEPVVLGRKGSGRGPPRAHGYEGTTCLGGPIGSLSRS